MLVMPNQTVLDAVVEAIRPEADGWGAQIDLQVERNLSAGSDADFLRLAPGARLTAFFAEPDLLRVGDAVHLAARLVADEHGGRAVIERLEPVA